MTCGFLIQLVACVQTSPPPSGKNRERGQLVFCQKKKTMWFIGVEVEQETSAPPPKKKSWIRPCVISARWEDKSWCPLYSDIKLVTASFLLPIWDVWYVWTHNMRRAKTKPWKKCPSLFCNISVDPFCCLEKNKQNKGKGGQANGSMPPPKIMSTETRLQCCALRNVEGSPVLWTCEIHGAQRMICMQKLRFSSCQRAKVRR